MTSEFPPGSSLFSKEKEKKKRRKGGKRNVWLPK